MLSLETYMARCLTLARQGEAYVAPNPMVGAVLVAADGTILGEGWHRRYGEGHAEVNCFTDYDQRQAEISHTASTLENKHIHPLSDATLFVSLEPCSHHGKTPPCADLIIRRGVRRVVVGALDPNPLVAGNGVRKLREAGIKVITGVLEKECKALNKRFMCLHEKHRPYVILKWAQTADGFIAPLPQGDKEQPRLVISNRLTKQIVHKMRSENMAIMVGATTALLDNPRLTLSHWAGRNPTRILLDRRGRVPADYHIFSDDAPTIVYRENTDWNYILSNLAARNIHSVLVEGGATLLRYILSTGIYDELHIEVNPALNIGAGIEAPEVELPLIPTAVVEGNLLYEIRC